MVLSIMRKIYTRKSKQKFKRIFNYPKKIANILWKRDMHFLSTMMKYLIYTTKTHLKMVGLSVV